MPKCKECGNEVSYYAKVCQYCNAPQELINKKYSVEDYDGDQSSFIRALVSFIFPFIGLVLLFMNIGVYPKRTISIIKGLILGVILWIILGGQIIVLLFFVGV